MAELKASDLVAILCEETNRCRRGCLLDQQAEGGDLQDSDEYMIIAWSDACKRQSDNE